MDWETLANLTMNALKQDFAKHLIFEWHGGEPLLMGRSFYEKALALQKASQKPGQEIENTIQTNALILNECWVEFFQRNGFHVGVSLDGPAPVHDEVRRTLGNRNSFLEALRATHLLKSSSMRFGVLSVVTRKTLQIDATEFLDFYYDLGIDSFDLLPQEPNFLKTRDGFVVTGDNLYPSADPWLSSVFEQWIQNQKYHGMRIRIFENIMRGLLGLSSHVCNIGKGTCIGNLLGILPDGSVYHCDKFFHDSEYRIGNANIDSFEDMLRTPRIAWMEKKNVHAVDNLNCRWRDICRGGCPFVRYAFTFQRGWENYPCCGHELLYDRIYTLLLKHCPEQLSKPTQLVPASG
jgi:uncharacterized protein